jgi:hypothetical protein
VFVDSDHGVLMLYEGKMHDNFLDLYTELNPEVDLLLRTRYHFISADSFSIESARSADQGKTWDRTSTLKYTRKN